MVERQFDVHDTKSNDNEDDDNGNSNHADSTAKKTAIVSTTLDAIYKVHTDMVQLI